MPLKIVFQAFPQKKSYAVIGQTGCGRMDESTPTPTEGLATFGASSCTVIIGHCAKLKRTILIHSPNYMHVKVTLEPLFDWTIGKREENYSGDSTLEVVLLRGYLYRDPLMSLSFNHEGFMKNFRQFIRDTYSSLSVNIDDTNLLVESSNGSVLVDKTTAKITVLELPLMDDAYAKLATSAYNLKQLNREIFAHDLFPFVYPNNGKIITSRHLQFDVNRYTLHSLISDHCRLVLRSKCSLNQTDKELKDLLNGLNIHIDEMMFANLTFCLRQTNISVLLKKTQNFLNVHKNLGIKMLLIFFN